MLKININKDISEYSEGIVAGITMKEILRLLAVAFVAIILAFLFSMFMPLILAIYLTVPVIAVMLLAGKKIANMTARDMIEYYPVYKAMKKGISYKSTETIDMSEHRKMIKEIQDVKEE